MGTRSHTNFIEVTANGNDLICSVYQQSSMMGTFHMLAKTLQIS